MSLLLCHLCSYYTCVYNLSQLLLFILVGSYKYKYSQWWLICALVSTVADTLQNCAPTSDAESNDDYIGQEPQLTRLAGQQHVQLLLPLPINPLMMILLFLLMSPTHSYAYLMMMQLMLASEATVQALAWLTGVAADGVFSVRIADNNNSPMISERENLPQARLFHLFPRCSGVFPVFT